MPLSVIDGLKAKGHKVIGNICGHERALFGRGHIITPGAWWRGDRQNIEDDTSVLWAGSDPRADGLALAY